jgi:hypothetical protein
MTTAAARALGQFFTTHYTYILQGFEVPADVARVVEPFCGAGHLLAMVAGRQPAVAVAKYDIAPASPDVERRDTLLSPPDYAGAFILTNPPYKARNKCGDKTVFDLYGVNDLYKCFVKNIATTNPCAGGIVVLPLNFWCSTRPADAALRGAFLARYDNININVFEEQVFDDTTYTVCAFQFAARTAGAPPFDPAAGATVRVRVFPANEEFSANLRETNRFLMGGDIYSLPLRGVYRVSRLTTRTLPTMHRTGLVAKCIDDCISRPIELRMDTAAGLYIDTTPNLSARTYAAIVTDPAIDAETQAALARRFNVFLRARRDAVRSLFLPNFRDSTDVARKRLSFDLLYGIIAYLLENPDVS